MIITQSLICHYLLLLICHMYIIATSSLLTLFKCINNSNVTHILTFYVSDKGKNVHALKNVETVCTVPSRTLLTPSYYHSFGMTDNYFIFIEQPFKLDILKMATAYMRGVNWASCLKFCPEENVRDHCSFCFESLNL